MCKHKCVCLCWDTSTPWGLSSCPFLLKSSWVKDREDTFLPAAGLTIVVMFACKIVLIIEIAQGRMRCAQESTREVHKGSRALCLTSIVCLFVCFRKSTSQKKKERGLAQHFSQKMLDEKHLCLRALTLQDKIPCYDHACKTHSVKWPPYVTTRCDAL